jgi:Fe/S biogenesis protein NfuA
MCAKSAPQAYDEPEQREDRIMLTFTDRARTMVRDYMDQSGDELSALRIHLNGGSPIAPSFELTLVEATYRGQEDVVLDAGGFTVLVDPRSAERLDGATVDFVERVNESGFEVVPAPLKQRPAPEGPIADQVKAILEQQVNPSIASHGGRIELVDVQGTEIYMEMTGGCQGCSMSRMTLRQGVERTLRQAVPEITMVHDVTDHASGENPYFSS